MTSTPTPTSRTPAVATVRLPGSADPGAVLCAPLLLTRSPIRNGVQSVQPAGLLPGRCRQRVEPRVVPVVLRGRASWRGVRGCGEDEDGVLRSEPREELVDAGLTRAGLLPVQTALGWIGP